MSEFLHGTSILTAASDLIANGNGADLAVAFWGNTAGQRLGLDTTTRQVRIICDLLSGGCNPREIESLMKRPNITIKHRSKLHAKVYASPDRAIVGSANASTNGLWDEGETGTIEAAIATSEKEVVDSVNDWFGKTWKAADVIDKYLMKQAWEAYRKPGPRSTRSVLEILLENPVWFRRKVWVTYFETSAHPAAAKTVKAEKSKYFSKKQLETFRDNEPHYYDFDTGDFTDENIGDYIIDLAENELYRVLKLIPYSSKAADGVVVLLEPGRDRSIFRARLLKREISMLYKSLEPHFPERETGGLIDYAVNLEDLPAVALQSIRQRLTKTRAT